jgi:TetR/AcrR family transcriptional regulator, transcriptional repressor of bet genes
MSDNDSTRPGPPKKTRAEAKVERRQALIDATIASIAKYGLSGTTIARVTENAGTSIGLASFYFDTKEVLFEAVLRHLADEERDLWRARTSDPALGPMDRLVAMLDARFHIRSCDRKKVAVWFAFWGDAGTRRIYRRVVDARDDERLEYAVEIIESLPPPPAGMPGRDPLQTALGLEALYDGLWLNHLLYPSEFRRLQCRAIAFQHLTALFADQFDDLPGGLAEGAPDAPGDSPPEGTEP